MQLSFKPYYKWNIFNTYGVNMIQFDESGFKPYYKWNTFNTKNWIKNPDVKYVF